MRPSLTTARKLIAPLAVSLLLAAPALAQAGAARTRPPTCRSGRTLFRAAGPIRAFVLVSEFDAGRPDASPVDTFYVCRPDSRTPRVISRGEPYARESAGDFKLLGERLGFVIFSAGVQSGSQAELGWIDLRIGRVRSAVINASEGLISEAEEEPGLPKVPDGHLRYAIAEDGTVALAGEGGFPFEWEVCELPVGVHALGRPRALYTAPRGGEGVELDSIAITPTSITWTTQKGLAMSAPR